MRGRASIPPPPSIPAVLVWTGGQYRWAGVTAAELVLTSTTTGLQWRQPPAGGGGGGGLTSPVGISDGGTGATTASAARTALGLAIGSDVAAYDAGLVSLAAVDTAADRLPYTSGSATWTWTTLTAAGRALLDDVDAAAQRDTLDAASRYQVRQVWALGGLR